MPRLRTVGAAIAIVAAVAGTAIAQTTAEFSAKAYEVMVQGMYLKFSDVPQLKPEAVAKGVEAGEYILLDIRSADEFAVSHLKGARLVPYEGFTAEAVQDIPKDAPILVYCSVGYRSSDVAAQMMTAGFTQVSDLYGGAFLWNNQARPLYRGADPVDQIHPYDTTWGRWISRGTSTTTPLPLTEEAPPQGETP